MNKLIQYITQFLFLFLLSVGLSACTNEEWISGGGKEEPIPEGKVRVKLSAGGGNYYVPVTRANETDLSGTLWVLVFKNNGGIPDETAIFVEAQPVNYILDNGVYTGMVELIPQTSSCQLLLIANTPTDFYSMDGLTTYEYTKDNLNAQLAGKTLGDITGKMLLTPPFDPQNILLYGDDEDFLPMSSITRVNSIEKLMEITATPLTRVVAKMVVRVDNTDENPDFALLGITEVLSVPKQGKLHLYFPDNSLPTDQTADYRTIDGSDIVSVTDDGKETLPIYLYETLGDTHNISVIIHAEYQGKEYYYKMALATDAQPDLAPEKVDVERNHFYIFTIKKIDGRGHDNLEEAINGAPFNDAAIIELTVTDPSGYETTAGPDYYISVSHSYVIDYTTSQTTQNAFSFVLKGRNYLMNGFIRAKSDGVVIEGTSSFSTSNDTETLPQWVNIQITEFDQPQEIEITYGNLKKVIMVEKRTSLAADTDSDGLITPNEFYYASGQVETGSSLLYNSTSSIEDIHGNKQLSVDDGIIRIKRKSNGIINLATGQNPSDTEKKEAQRIKVYLP